MLLVQTDRLFLRHLVPWEDGVTDVFQQKEVTDVFPTVVDRTKGERERG